MARSRRSSSRSAGDWTLPSILVAFLALGWLGEQPRWRQVLVIITGAVALGAWSVLLWTWTRCNVPTPYSVRSERCTNRVRGRLRACGVTGHRYWKRRELVAMLLRRPPLQPPTSRSRAAGPPRPRQPAAPPAAAAEGDFWLLQEIPYRAWTLGVATAGAVATVISTIATIYTLVTTMD